MIKFNDLIQSIYLDLRVMPQLYHFGKINNKQLETLKDDKIYRGFMAFNSSFSGFIKKVSEIDSVIAQIYLSEFSEVFEMIVNDFIYSLYRGFSNDELDDLMTINVDFDNDLFYGFEDNVKGLALKHCVIEAIRYFSHYADYLMNIKIAKSFKEMILEASRIEGDVILAEALVVNTQKGYIPYYTETVDKENKCLETQLVTVDKVAPNKTVLTLNRYGELKYFIRQSILNEIVSDSPLHVGPITTLLKVSKNTADKYIDKFRNDKKLSHDCFIIYLNNKTYIRQVKHFKESYLEILDTCCFDCSSRMTYKNNDKSIFVYEVTKCDEPIALEMYLNVLNTRMTLDELE